MLKNAKLRFALILAAAAAIGAVGGHLNSSR
jgi:hypothetical protein